MFRDDFEFNDQAAPSHLGAEAAAPVATAPILTGWEPSAEAELKKIPFFVRGKARKNTELFAAEHGVTLITIETIYDAKAHFSR